MIVHPNKPIIYGIVHDADHVRKAMARFKETIRGKKILYIEVTPSDIDQIIKDGKFSKNPGLRSYQRLILEAHNTGLEIRPLDDERQVITGTFLDEKNPFLRKLLLGDYCWYNMHNQREKRWMRLLEGEKSSTVAVMHPVHAIAISHTMGIPTTNRIIVGFSQRSHFKRLEVRAIANRYGEVVDQQRLERAKQRAKSRTGKLRSHAK